MPDYTKRLMDLENLTDGLEKDVLALQIQTGRLKSDFDSEKGTHNRVATDFENRMRAVEKAIWKATGTIAILTTLVNAIITFAIKTYVPNNNIQIKAYP